MVTFREEIENAVRAQACAVLSGVEAASWYGSALDFGNDENRFAEGVRGLRRSFCNNDDDVVDIPSPPFTGGQCAGASYSVSFTQTGTAVGTPTSQTGAISGLTGPISNVFNKDIGSFPGNRRVYQVCVSHAGGEKCGISNALDPGSQELEDIVVTRTDGLPDDCGSLPAPIPPYSPTATTVNISYENINNIQVNEDVDIEIFAPQVNLIGGIFAPIVISGNTFQLVGTAQISPEFKLEISPNINVGRGGGVDETLPNPSEPVPEGNEDNGSRVIVGAIVTATSLELRKVGQISQAGNPDIFIPRLGSLSFYIAVDNGTAWTNDIDIKNLRCYIPCPVSSGAVDVAATSENGVQLDVQPVWGYPSQRL